MSEDAVLCKRGFYEGKNHVFASKATACAAVCCVALPASEKASLALDVHFGSVCTRNPAANMSSTGQVVCGGAPSHSLLESTVQSQQLSRKKHEKSSK